MASFGAGRHQPQLYDTIQVYFAALNQALEAFDGKRAAKLLGFDVISRQLAREFGEPVSSMAAYLCPHTRSLTSPTPSAFFVCQTVDISMMVRQSFRSQNMNRQAYVAAHVGSVVALYNNNLAEALKIHLEMYG